MVTNRLSTDLYLICVDIRYLAMSLILHIHINIYRLTTYKEGFNCSKDDEATLCLLYFMSLLENYDMITIE